MTAIGGFIRPHFHRLGWDLFFSPGVQILNLERGDEDDTGLGLSFSTGLHFQLHESFALGIEHFVTTPWFADDEFQGVLIQDLMIRGRFSF